MQMDAYDFIRGLRMLRHAMQYINDQTTGEVWFGDLYCSVEEDYPLLEAIVLLEKAEHDLIGEIL